MKKKTSLLQVSCSIQIGASTGGVDKSNFLCILGNNLFNQKYFLILWVWWVFLLVVAVLGLIYRVTRILVPDFSRYLLVFVKYDQESFIFCVRERCLVISNISIYPLYVLKSSRLQTLFPLDFVKLVFVFGQIFQNNLF